MPKRSTAGQAEAVHGKGRAAPRPGRRGPGPAGGGELAFLRALRARAATFPSAPRPVLGIGDDCAILRPPAGHDVLITTDFFLETRHFDRNLHSASSAGHRCLARGLSDLAAMGARPLGAFLSLALPRGTLGAAKGRAWVQGFLDGLLALAEHAGTPLAGGDTATAPGAEILADIVLAGSAPRGTALRRGGARAGDFLYVTGALGGAAAELVTLQRRSRSLPGAQPDGTHPQLFPEPRLRAGHTLRARHLATAAIDVSDGLSTDLHHLCEESGVGAVVRAEALPIHPLARTAPDGGLHWALHGGEDYELLFAARPGTPMPRSIAGVAIHRIGRFTRARGTLLQQGHTTEPLHAQGWEHEL